MERIVVEAADGPAEADVARPPSGHGPGVLLYIDAIGLRPRIAAMAERIASWGYVVLAPNVLYRSGTAQETTPSADLREPGQRESFFAEAMPRVHRLTPELVLADAARYTEALVGLDGVDDGPLGVVGYCMGARLAVLTASADPRYAAVGAFHAGGLVTDGPDSPHLALPSARAEFVFGRADHDPSMPASAVDELGRALEAAGLVHTNEIYPGAEHGYSMADTAAYDEAAAERMFAELEALFGRALGRRETAADR